MWEGGFGRFDRDEEGFVFGFSEGGEAVLHGESAMRFEVSGIDFGFEFFYSILNSLDLVLDL